jgi:hypothetical protein
MEPMAEWITKDQLDECLDRIEGIERKLRTLANIEVTGGQGQALTLDEWQRRAVRIFARRNAGTVATATVLRGGLSATTAVRVVVRNSLAQVVKRAVAKIGHYEDVVREEENYRQHVNAVLPIGTFAQQADAVHAGVGSTHAIFYGLAEDYRSLYDVLAVSDADGAGVVGPLAAIAGAWTATRAPSQETIGGIRRLLTEDDVFEELRAEFEVLRDVDEALPCQVGIAVQHGDLHGDNILIMQDGRPILIDFASMLRAPSTFDPVTLELSLLFHPGAQPLRGEWPSAHQAEAWTDLNAYTVGCPVPDFIRTCRGWAWSTSESERELYATVYAVAVRHLQREGIDKALAVGLIRCVRNILPST